MSSHWVLTAICPLQAKNILIATGGRAQVPPIEGKEHTIISDQVLDLPKRPDRYVLVSLCPASFACCNLLLLLVNVDSAQQPAVKSRLICNGPSSNLNVLRCMVCVCLISLLALLVVEGSVLCTASAVCI